MPPSENPYLKELSIVQKEALKKLGKIGADQAAQALTEFLEQSIFIEATSFEMVKIKSVPNFLQNQFSSDAKIAIFSASNTMEIGYTVLILFDKEIVNKILSQKSPESHDIEAVMEFSTMFMDLLKEIGSIILIKYILTLNNFLNFEGTLPSQPLLRIGKLDSLVNNELIDFKKALEVLVIECDIHLKEEFYFNYLKTDIILIPHQETYFRFFNTIFQEHLQ
jgi:chemotaxis protein CheY-P-specific phosphatase CheC